ncbi:hypothetical protein AWB99_07040 [Mycolicibacterium confluentis]|nr:hypothetical protein AWB99_07040 [Mycolicibacterium confluentis]
MAKTAAVTAAAMATTAALTLGVTSPAFQAQVERVSVGVEQRAITAEVELAAIVGLYGVGPVFWIADALGITPENVILGAVGLLDNPTITAAVQQILTVVGLVVETGAPGPLPGDIYDSVNGLSYTGDLVLGPILGAVPPLVKNLPIVGPVAEALNDLFGTNIPNSGFTVEDAAKAIVKATPILNQRRAIIFSEGLGALSTSLAYRDMIEAVTSNDPDWGEGVTAQWLIFLNNVSRPGGGLLSLATPFTNLFGVDLTTPAAGSYTNKDSNGKITKILNTSVLDISWAYNATSDAPSTLNPLAWANAIAGSILLTYLIPDDLNFGNTNLGSQVGPLALGLLNGAGVMVDITGGQGSAVIPLINKIFDLLQLKPLPGIVGKDTFITYDSGNLPLLEPFDLGPRLLGILGVNVPQPLLNSIEGALRLAVNTGYQDVDPATLLRGFDMGGEQALLWHSPLTPSQQVEGGQIIANRLLDDIQANLLNPVAWTPSVFGQAAFNDMMKALIQNQIALAVSALVNQGIDGAQGLANGAFDGLQTALKPLLQAADGFNAQTEGAVDDALGVGGSSSFAKIQALDTTNARALEADGKLAPEGDQGAPEPKKPTSLKSALAELNSVDLLEDSDLAKSAKATAAALKKQRAQVRADLKEAGDKIQKELKKTGDAVEKAVNNVKKNVDKAGDSVKQAVDNAKPKPAKKALAEAS